jgi:ketosteroid isomerase-like protein
MLSTVSWRRITRRSTIGKEELLASFRSGERGWEEALSDEHDVRIYGDTAVVTGRWRARGANAGQPFDYAARYVSVWVEQDGEGRMVSDHSPLIA